MEEEKNTKDATAGGEDGKKNVEEESKKQPEEQKEQDQEQGKDETKAISSKSEESKDEGSASGKEDDEDKAAQDSEAFYQSKIEDLRVELKQVRAGTHERVKEQEKMLQHRKLQSIDEAQRMRDLRIREAEALYSFDMKAANDAFANSYKDAQAKVAGELEDTIKRLEVLREGHGEEVRSSSRKLRGKKAGGNHDGEDTADETTGMELDEGAILTANSASEAAPARVSAPGGYGSESLGVNFFMTEDNIYDDLRAIQSDWKSRAEKFLSQDEIAKQSVRVEDGVLYYNEHILEKDQDVVCYTEISKEQIQGAIQSINSSEVIVKLLDGSQTRVLIKFLRSGRCTIGPLSDEMAL